MVQNRKSQAAVIILLLLCMDIALAVPFDNESLTFRAYYQGLFSGDEMIGIADIQWKTQRVDLDKPGETALETRMEISSEAYNFVENLYPFRLVYRSLVSLQTMESIAYERYDSTDKHGKELTWLDAKSSLALRFRDGDGDKTDIQLPGVIMSWGSEQQDYLFYKPARHKALPQMVDEMALLQQIRREKLTVGAQFKIPVTDGKRQYLYKVSVVDSEPLTIANKSRDTLKVKFEGYRIKIGASKQDHHTVWVWLENTPQSTPLRFEYRNSIGQFLIDLHSLAIMGQTTNRNHYN